MEELLKKTLTPPYKPEIQEDLAYFDQKLVQQTELADSVLPQVKKDIII